MHVGGNKRSKSRFQLRVSRRNRSNTNLIPPCNYPITSTLFNPLQPLKQAFQICKCPPSTLACVKREKQKAGKLLTHSCVSHRLSREKNSQNRKARFRTHEQLLSFGGCFGEAPSAERRGLVPLRAPRATLGTSRPQCRMREANPQRRCNTRSVGGTQQHFRDLT